MKDLLVEAHGQLFNCLPEWHSCSMNEQASAVRNKEHILARSKWMKYTIKHSRIKFQHPQICKICDAPRTSNSSFRIIIFNLRFLIFSLQDLPSQRPPHQPLDGQKIVKFFIRYTFLAMTISVKSAQSFINQSFKIFPVALPNKVPWARKFINCPYCSISVLSNL